jgi:lysophospholipase L1-like esterase
MYQTFLRLSLIAIAMTLATTILAYPQTDQWETDIKKFEQADQLNKPPMNGVLFIGSSSFRLWTTLADDFPNTKVINRGFGGSQIVDSTRYVDRIVVPYQPRMVLLYAGDNDLAAGKSPQQVLEDYKAFVDNVKQKLPKTRIGFVSIKPSPLRAALLAKAKEANELIKSFTSDDKRLFYIDVFTPMLGSDGNARPELFGPDKLHMNQDGYKLWKSIIAPYLK